MKIFFMNIKLVCSILVLAGIMLACSSEKKEVPIDTDLLLGIYVDNMDGRDSIYIYIDKSYKHTFSRRDGTVDSQKGRWYYKSENNCIFFEEFVFYNDGEPNYFKGSWPTKVFLNEEGEIKLRYSENVYYVKTTRK